MKRNILQLALLLACLAAPFQLAAQGTTKVQGVVQTAPNEGTVGNWLIGGHLITVTAMTEIEGDAAELIPGACVEAEGDFDNVGALVAEQIEVKDADDCGGVGQEPTADTVNFTAEASSAPTGGLIGTWMIGQWTVITDGFTNFDSPEASFASGACVEVDGVVLANGNVRASEMDVEDDERCGPFGNQGGQEAELRGIAEALPASQTFGEWNVRGFLVLVDAGTDFNDDAGPVEMGACVKVEGDLNEAGDLEAREITILAEERCGEPNPSSIEFVGGVDSVPANARDGVWTVMGVDVTVNSRTQLALELGPALPGACVMVEGAAEMGQVTTRQIRVLGLDCGVPPDNQQTISFEGQVQSTPPQGNTGLWRVSGRSVLVNGTTNVDLGGQQPSTSLCVEVQGDVTGSGLIQATRLIALSEACAASPGLPALTEVTGAIDTLPDGAGAGLWVVGGMQIMVSEATEQNTDLGAFVAGACVRIEGRSQSDGSMIAREIETRAATDCSADGNQVEFTGLVSAKPAGEQIGEWTISEQMIDVVEETELDTTNGPLRLGACVEVMATSQQDGSLQATRLDVQSASGVCVQAVVSAGSFEQGSVSPGEILTVFGLGFGPGSGLGLVVENGHVTNRLGGVQVFFDGEPATILYVSGNQINVVAPYSLAGKSTTTMQVSWAGAFTKTVELTVVEANPALLTLQQTGSGQAAVLNWEEDTQMYTVNGPDNPARPGQIVVFYAVGAGQTTPAGEDGLVIDANSLPRPNLPVGITIGGLDAEILYAGAAPGFVAGVLQVNARVPQNLTASGDVETALEVGQLMSASGVTIYIQQ